MHVAHSWNMKFNLCSLSKLCQDGWKMKGNKDFFVMERNNQKIKFDIKVTTATGVICPKCNRGCHEYSIPVLGPTRDDVHVAILSKK
jgi:hypothetical protein